MKSKVYIELGMEYFHKDAVDMLSGVADLVFEPLLGEEFRREITEASAAIIYLKKIGEEFLDLAPKLKIIARLGVGYDNVDVEACSKRGIYVTNTPNVLSDAVAELAFALIFSLTRKIREADRYVRTEWARKETRFPLGVDLKEKNIGIIGMGRIGYQVAKRAHAFGMNIFYYSSRRKRDVEEKFNAKFSGLDDLLRSSDFVSIHVPLNEKTRGMIGERELNLMKKSAYIINTSRGPTVDQRALTQCLQKRMIAGAGLDVFDTEPIPLDDSLLQLDNIVLTPHIGSATVETKRAVAIRAAENVLYTLKGKVPRNLVPEQAEVIPKKS